MTINRTVLRALDILEILSGSNEGLTLGDIVKMLDIPKSSAFDITQTLLSKDYIEYDNKRLKSFKLGLKSFRLGSSYLKNINLYNESKPVLNELLARTNKIIFLATRSEDKIIYLDKLEPNLPITAQATIGGEQPLYCTGLGKSLLATLTDDAVKQLLGDGPYEKKTNKTITNLKKLIKELESIRKKGYSNDNGENESQIYCVAAPIYDYTNKAVAAISISSLDNTNYKKEERNLGNLVKKAAMRISEKLGFKGKFYRELNVL